MEKSDKSYWLDKPIFKFAPEFTVYHLLITLILIFAIVSRTAMLGERTMDHDEINHVNPSYQLFLGNGYQHSPMTHGPLQFHLISLSYFLFGDGDFTSRLPHALFSIATVAFILFGFRKILGRTGSLVGGLLFTISPYMLFYGRYARNEAFVGLFTVLTIYAVLKYLADGKESSLYLLTASIALHFATKETAFIATATLLIFLAVVFVSRLASAHWKERASQRTFLLSFLVAIFSAFSALMVAAWSAASFGNKSVEPDAAATFVDMTPGWVRYTEFGLVALALLFGIIALFILFRKYGWKRLRSERSFDMLILVVTLILPQLTAVPVKLVGNLLHQNWNPLDYSSTGILHTGIVLFIMVAISVIIGTRWKAKFWAANFALFYAIFIIFYTTVFTNGQGFFTGIVGALGYWMAQQEVVRGGQPIYYYAFLQMPIYEYFGVIGTVVATYFAAKYHLFKQWLEDFLPDQATKKSESNGTSSEVKDNLVDEDPDPYRIEKTPVMAMLLFWSLMSLLAYSVAGERMPWITVHITLPFLLAAGWGFGYLIDTGPWAKFRENKSWVGVLLIPVFISALLAALGSLLGPNPPFQGNTTDQLNATATFVTGAAVTLISAVGIARLMRSWDGRSLGKLGVALVTVLFAALTWRTAYTASFINYNNSKEYLVFAHGAQGPLDIVKQVEDISVRTTKGLDIQVAYDANGRYPMQWYLRRYTKVRDFDNSPTRELKDYPLIIASGANWGKIDSITRGNFDYFEYHRLWWPMQDYYNLTWDRVKFALTDSAMRSAIFQIWLNRDYTEYAALTGSTTLTVSNWEPSEKLRLYIRKDVIASIWKYGAAPVINAAEASDPYTTNRIPMVASLTVGTPGSGDGQLQAPRGFVFAPDGTIYIADSRNNRIEHFSASGEFIKTWGTYGNVADNPQLPGGSFFEPWGIAVDKNGNVFVTDTWNHRIQKFDSNGTFIKMWGYFNNDGSPNAFWGPRDITIDAQDRLYVTDTGNKRVAIFDLEGNFIGQFGTAGMEPGQFDEQVGIAINSKGEILVADTWNQRIQVFSYDPATNAATYLRGWDVSAWFSNTVENKPFIAVDKNDNVYITDPEGYRVIEFNNEGAYLRSWGDYSTTIDGFGLPSGIKVDSNGSVWVSDAGNNALLRYELPPLP